MSVPSLDICMYLAIKEETNLKMKTHNNKQKPKHSNQVKNESFFSRKNSEPFIKPSHVKPPVIQMGIDKSEKFSLNEKLMRVYSKVKNTEQFKTMVKGFNESKSHLDLEI